jgi:hypothetical protein
MQHFRFRAFKAANELQTCLKFKEEHQNVLKDYGITNVTSNNDAWMYDPAMFCIVAEQNRKIVGGVRLQISTRRGSLPVEAAIGKMDELIYTVVDRYRNAGGIAELCALWNARGVAGTGISKVLVRTGVAAAIQLPVKSLLSICADYTIAMFQEAGFREVKELSRKNGYPYPNNTYQARVLKVEDSGFLTQAGHYAGERIKSLRESPIQQHIETDLNRPLKADYDLIFNNHTRQQYENEGKAE